MAPAGNVDDASPVQIGNSDDGSMAPAGDVLQLVLVVNAGGNVFLAPTVRSCDHELVPQLQFRCGYRFMPTDEELVSTYLRCKIDGLTPPLDVINEVDITSLDPDRLIEKYKGYGENRWYFYTVRDPSKINKKNEPNRKVVVDGVEMGSWSATGSVAQIRRTSTTTGMDRETIIGSKRVLTYRSVRSPEDDKWSMHEYLVADKSQMVRYVLCMIQLKHTYTAKRKAEQKGQARKTRNMTTTASSHEQEMMVAEADQFHASTPDSSLSSDDIVQLQTEIDQELAIQYGLQEPQPLPSFSDELMIEQGCSGEYQFYQQQAENGGVVSGEALDDQQCYGYGYLYSNNGFPDGSLQDHDQHQLGRSEDGTAFELRDDTLLAEQQDVCYDDDADGQLDAVEHADGDYIGDEYWTCSMDDLSSLLDDDTPDSLPGELQRPSREESTMPTGESAEQP
ncbi:hypothetical protein ABZP36_008968 [Zizania latifolia]